jgi:hypothetical protein
MFKEIPINDPCEVTSLVVGPTLELFITVEPTALQKRLDPRYEAGVIDTSIEQ